MRAAAIVLTVALPLAVGAQGTAALPVAQSGPPASQEVPADPELDFSVWLTELVAEARSRGFGDELLAQTLSGLEPLHRVIQSDRNQAELNPGFARYLSGRLTTAMIRQGRDKARQHRSLLTKIEAEYGVPRRILLAIWGVETRYGRLTGGTPVFQALATLAWEPRRAEYFRGELFNALMMVDRRYIDARSMTGSWAGAMGQTQFMPSSYLRYAVDFDHDGRRDIWKSTADSLASIANYLKGYGWTPEFTWGREVRVPPAALARIATAIPQRPEGCYAIRNMTERRPLAEWRALGVTRIDGGSLPQADVSAGLVDVGERKFLVYPNYDALLGYNCAHYYALSVGLLAEQIAGTAAPRATAPARRAAPRRQRSPR